MKQLLMIFFLLTGLGFATQARASDLKSFYEMQFAKYPADEIDPGPKGQLQISTNAKARRYRTHLRTEWDHAKAPNFAGHYFVAGEIGCGTGCAIVLIVDWKTGRVFSPPEDHAFAIRKTSRLLILKPYFECTAYGPPMLYEFNEGKFQLIAHQECAPN